jgi:hypothetical protein
MSLLFHKYTALVDSFRWPVEYFLPLPYQRGPWPARWIYQSNIIPHRNKLNHLYNNERADRIRHQLSTISQLFNIFCSTKRCTGHVYLL